jgi:hypothetical protein
MAGRRTTMAQYQEIKRLISEGLSDRSISRSLRCRRAKVADIRNGVASDPSIPLILADPLWTNQIDWNLIKRELGMQHPLKFIWEEKASSLISYPGFWKFLHKKFPELKSGFVTSREFVPGEYAEVDWAGDSIEWLDSISGEIKQAKVFIGCLCYSQLIFAYSTENMKERSFLYSHRKMYEYFQGVPKVTVPDCTKTAVLKCHIYDPDLNPSYTEMASYYGTCIVPARPRRPKDKALVEGAVKIVMRLFRWTYRRHTFFSIGEINQALLETIKKINLKKHQRFGVSRQERYELEEKDSLKKLPETSFECVEWKDAVLHPDSCVSLDSQFYSAPHQYRGKNLQVRKSENLVEIFFEQKRIAVHARSYQKIGKKIINPDHLPENAKAYLEATPQHLLSQARFILPELHQLINELFEKDTCGYIRIVQGLIKTTLKEINNESRSDVYPRIRKAIETMKSFNKIRVPYYRELLLLYRKENIPTENREIIRKPGNPMLRHTGEQLAMFAE